MMHKKENVFTLKGINDLTLKANSIEDFINIVYNSNYSLIFSPIILDQTSFSNNVKDDAYKSMVESISLRIAVLITEISHDREREELCNKVSCLLYEEWLDELNNFQAYTFLNFLLGLNYKDSPDSIKKKFLIIKENDLNNKRYESKLRKQKAQLLKNMFQMKHSDSFDLKIITKSNEAKNYFDIKLDDIMNEIENLQSDLFLCIDEHNRDSSILECDNIYFFREGDTFKLVNHSNFGARKEGYQLLMNFLMNIVHNETKILRTEKIKRFIGKSHLVSDYIKMVRPIIKILTPDARIRQTVRASNTPAFIVFPEYSFDINIPVILLKYYSK